MWIVRHLIPGRRAPSGPVRYANCLTRWDRVRLDGEPGVTMAAHVPDDHPDAAEIRRMIRSFDSTSIVTDRSVEPIDGTPVVVSGPVRSGPPVRTDVDRLADRIETLASTGFDQGDVESIAEAVGLEPSAVALRNVLHLCNIVRTNGWSIHDFRGAGQMGEPGEAGGRSPRSGLTLSELALTRPPMDWDALVEAGRPPWESADWTPPAIVGWLPPSWPDKVILLDQPADLKPGEITDPEGYAAALASGAITEIPPDDPRATAPVGDIVIDPSILPAGDDTTEEEEGDDEAGPLAGYPVDSADAAAEVCRDLKKRQGKIPHPNAVNFHLKAANLPQVNKRQIEALLEYHPTPTT